MNGAQALIQTLVDSRVDTCFMNPGTSEMHFVAALDSVPGMKGVLGLFEGVATGAADGFGRMAEHPAATLLHLGPGLGNGIANLHNARRAQTPVVNIVGDHATYHKKYDAPLESDVEALAGAVSPDWVRRSTEPQQVGEDAADAVVAALGPPGRVATLLLPADVSWLEGAQPVPPRPLPERSVVPATRITDIAAVLRSDVRSALLVGGSVLRRPGLHAAARCAAASEAKLLAETFPARLERGAGIPPVERLGYLAEFVEAQLAGVEHLVVVDTRAPVSFFAYPGKASDLVPEGCEVHVLATDAEDGTEALESLAEELGAPFDGGVVQEAGVPELPTGSLTGEAVADALGALLPEGAVVSDEGNTQGLWAPLATAGAPPHDWLTLTGGAIGQGMPVATGAALAAPGRKVVNLEADGSALYTFQSLWTQAREGLDITTIVLNNASYAVLNLELNRVGAEPPGPRALEMLDLTGPTTDFASLARGMGVEASRAETADELVTQLQRGLSSEGPYLIDAVVG